MRLRGVRNLVGRVSVDRWLLGGGGQRTHSVVVLAALAASWATRFST